MPFQPAACLDELSLLFLAVPEKTGARRLAPGSPKKLRKSVAPARWDQTGNRQSFLNLPEGRA